MAYGRVHEQFWDDPVVRAMPEDARTLMLYLLTCRHKNRLGCFVIDLGYAAADLQWDRARAESAMAATVSAGRAMYDHEHRVVFLPRWLKWNTLENHKVVAGAMSELTGLPDGPYLPRLLAAVEQFSRPHYKPIAEALRNRIGNGSPNGNPNGMAYRGTDHPYPYPLPEPLPEPSVPTDAVATATDAAGAVVDVDKSEQRTDEKAALRRLMPVLREAGFEADDRDGSIVKAIAKRGLEVDQVEAAIRGLALLRDAGELVDVLGVSRDDKLNLRILYAQDGPRAGPQPIWNVAVQRYQADLGRRESQRQGMKSVGEILKRSTG